MLNLQISAANIVFFELWLLRETRKKEQVIFAVLSGDGFEARCEQANSVPCISEGFHIGITASAGT